MKSVNFCVLHDLHNLQDIHDVYAILGLNNLYSPNGLCELHIMRSITGMTMTGGT